MIKKNKKEILILYLLIVVNLCYSNPILDRLMNISEEKEYKELRNFLKHLKSEEKICRYLWSTEIEREIDSNYYEEVIKIKESCLTKGSNNNKRINKYELQLIKKKRLIIYYRIVREKNVKKENKFELKKEILFLDSLKKEVLILQDKYRKNYNLDLIIDKLFESKIDYGTVGCGIDSYLPEFRALFIETIQEKNTSRITDWMKSGIVEKQLYGIEAIYKLSEEGCYVDKSILQMIKLVGKKKGRANYAKECFYWDKPIIEIVKEINAEYRKERKRIKKQIKY